MQAPTSSSIDNREIARQLEEMADYPDKNKFQKKAYLTAAKVIKNHPEPITSGELAKRLPGVGKSVASKIDEILTTGQIELLALQPASEKTKAQVIRLFKGIHGIGQVEAEALYNNNYRTLDDLAAHYNAGGFTPAQRLGIYYYNDIRLRIPRDEIQMIEYLLHRIYDPLNIDFIIAGSFRRMLPTSGDIDILVKSETKDGKQLAMSDIVTPLSVVGFLVGNLTPDAKAKFMGIVKLAFDDKAFPARRLDIRMIKPESWPYALLYFTGSKEFNIKMRNRALSFGLSLSEYGFDIQGMPYPPPNSDIKILTEEDVFNVLKIKYLAPHERTDTVQLEFTNQEVQAVGKWYRPQESLLIYISNILMTPTATPVKIIAGFDLDSTLIDNASGAKFTQNLDDMRVMPNRISTMQNLIAKGYTIVIFTNQKSTYEKRKEFTFQKLQKAVTLLGIPVILFAALGDDVFRKPKTGMWQEAEKLLVNVNWASSFYCGDAAGRPNDFSDSDLKFAQAKGVTFYIPEQIFV